MTADPTGGNGAKLPGSIVLYTQPHCSACRSVERYLGERDVPFEVRDVFEDAAALEDLESRGYLTTPVTRIGEQWLTGFHRAAFDEALATLASNAR